MTKKERDALPKEDFAIPAKRLYPIRTPREARAALDLVGMNGSEQEKRQVRQAVAARHPEIHQADRAKRATKPTK